MFCTPPAPCYFPDVGVFGTLTLDVLGTLNGPFLPNPPGPPAFTGSFSATGSFVGPGINIPLSGSGTTTMRYTAVYDPDPGYYFYAPAFISYDFVPVPEPAMMFTTALGLMALVLWSRRQSVS